MKKLVGLLICFAMILSLATATFAAGARFGIVDDLTGEYIDPSDN